METLKRNPEKIKNLVDSYDEYANRIDNGSDYRNALRRNDETVQILAGLGLTLDLKEITPVIKKEYEVMGYTVKTLDEAINKLSSHFSYLSERVKDRRDHFTQADMDEITSRIDKITEISYVPVEDIYSYSLKKVKREIPKDEL